MKNSFASSACLFLLCTLVMAGCQKGSPVITIESPEAALSPMLIGVASLFMKISNTGDAGDALEGAVADIPGTITELHDIVDGKMVKVEAITIPAGSQVMLRPAKQHIMVFKLPKDVKEGANFNLKLKFKKTGEKTILLQFTKPASDG